MYLIDAHQDLAYNILNFDRDYTLSAMDTRAKESGTETPIRNGDTMLGWPEYQKGRVALVFGTLFATPGRRADWEKVIYHDYEQANQVYRQQVDVYHRLTGDHPDKFQLVRTQSEFEDVIIEWEKKDEGEATKEDITQTEQRDASLAAGKPVGIVLLMEGAEGVRDPSELEEWWHMGVRLIGPAWSGNRFCGGTYQPGPLTNEGFALLEGMASVGFCLDISHMDGKAALQALDVYAGSIIASHSNVWRLLREDTNRQLTDPVIQELVNRNGVIGIVPMSPFLKAGWRVGDRRMEVSTQDVIAQLDTVCQMAGDSLHVGLGTDFDGGWGRQAAPHDIDTIADLLKLRTALAEKGYNEKDIANIFSQNWVRILHSVLPG